MLKLPLVTNDIKSTDTAFWRKIIVPAATEVYLHLLIHFGLQFKVWPTTINIHTIVGNSTNVTSTYIRDMLELVLPVVSQLVSERIRR